MVARIRVGVIGWLYPEWRGHIYGVHTKPADFLAQYALRFPIVEAASGGYGMPKTAAVAKWAADTPDDFELSLKVPEWILGKDPSDPDLSRVLGVLLDHLEPLHEAGKLGTLVAQFHPSFTREKRAARLAAFVAALPQGPRWAVELRHPSWWHEETYRLLEDSGVTLVWSELADGFRTPPVATTRSLYVRLMGDRELEPPFDAKRRDAGETLKLWAERILLAAPDVDRVDVLVSKFLEGYAPATVATLESLLHVPPREAVTATHGQTTLPFA